MRGSIRNFYQENLLEKLLKYGLVGLIAAAVDLTLFWVGVDKMGLRWELVAPLAFVVSTLVHYLLSIRLVFTTGQRFGRGAEIAAIFLASLVGLLINQITLWLLFEYLEFGTVVSKLIADASIIVWNYCVRAFFIFSPITNKGNADL